MLIKYTPGPDDYPLDFSNFQGKTNEVIFNSLKQINKDREFFKECLYLQDATIKDSISKILKCIKDINKINETFFNSHESLLPDKGKLFSEYITNPLFKRIDNNEFLLEMIYNGKLYETTSLVISKITNLEKTNFIFSINVKFYNWKFSKLSGNMFSKLDTLKDLIEIDIKKREVNALDFSLPFKEEAIQILILLSNIILNRYKFIELQGGITIDEEDNNVTFIFVSRKEKSSKLKSNNSRIETTRKRNKGTLERITPRTSVSRNRMLESPRKGSIGRRLTKTIGSSLGSQKV